MLQRVTLPGVELPRLYIAENAEDAELAKESGIPYVRWTKGCDALIRILLRPTLEKMFPHIAWYKVLGPKRKFTTKINVVTTGNEDYDGLLDTAPVEADELPEPEAGQSEEPTYGTAADGMLSEVASIASDTRVFDNGPSQMQYRKLLLEDYVGDLTACVNLEVLQRLRLMPSFIGDIMDCIKVNATSSVHWAEGYNKKLGCTVGNFNRSGQLPNLIILDVSGSIPRGVSATMIALVDTLRTQLSADLIITSSMSRFYPAGSELPDPETIRSMFGYGNESSGFLNILTRHVQGKHYGHVISFGDNDTPDYEQFEEYPEMYSLKNTKVEAVHHYHTGLYCYDYANHRRTGYAKWCHLLGCQPKEEYDTSWVKSIKED